MRYSIAAGLLASSGAAAFSDSSPFVMYSTSSKYVFHPSRLFAFSQKGAAAITRFGFNTDKLRTRFSPPSDPPQLQSTASVLATAQSLLSSCPTNLYLIFTHPNVHASDVRDPKSGSCWENHICAPHRYDNATKDWQPITGLYGVAEVVGPEISAPDLQSYIEDACAKKQKNGGSDDGATVLLTQLDPLPPADSLHGDRPWAMEFENRLIGRTVENRKQLQKPGADDDDEYTVIYFAGPHEPTYLAEFNHETGGNEVPLELRKRGWENVRADGGVGEPAKSAPLFVKYQFFTPGKFLVIVVFIRRSLESFLPPKLLDKS